MEKKCIVIEEGARAEFNNHVDFCIGTGRMGLALTKEYQEQLKLVQEETRRTVLDYFKEADPELAQRLGAACR